MDILARRPVVDKTPARPPPSSWPDWTVQCDFDGTISLEDTTDSLLRRFGRDGWQRIEDAWERGEIGSRECMTRQVALLDMDREAFEAHLGTIALDPHFAGFVRAARASGLAVQVVSDGLDETIRFLLERDGLGDLPVVANRLVQVGSRRWRLETPWSSAQCVKASANCKCARLAEAKGRRGRVLFVGDGSSDFCVAGRADHVLAKHRLLEHCRAHGIAHTAFADFSGVRAWLPHLS